MGAKVYAPGECYQYQLLIKHLLATPLFFAPDQEIVYRDKIRLTYRKVNERIHRLANGLAKLGVEEGDTVCVFDYDSHRYLEMFLRHSHDGGGSPHPELASLPGADPLYDEPCGGQGRPDS